MEKRKVSASAVVRDIRSGLDAAGLMEKYLLTHKQLGNVLEKLVAAGRLSGEEAAKLNAPSPIGTVPEVSSAPPSLNANDVHQSEQPLLPNERTESESDIRPHISATGASKQSLLMRGILAGVLMVGFYGLALAIAAVLIYIPYTLWGYHRHVPIKLTFFCIVGAAVVVWSILPRWDRFVPPGVLLDPRHHPLFFEHLKAISKASNQKMPAEVYLVPDVNAWVAQRGGIMGIGSRPVMGVGLMLLHVLRVSEFRAVVAHEFGHYFGGDTKLGPWIYKTRAAIFRTLENLSKHSTILQLPFVWYGKLFLRLTHAISRRQEYTADELSARIVGARPLTTGLQAVHEAAIAFDAFWMQDMAPALSAGYRPPMGAGFSVFMQSEPIKNAVAHALDDAPAEEDPYQTHPSLSDRIEAVKDLPLGPDPHNDKFAITLLRDASGLEGAIFKFMSGQEEYAKLKPIEWNDVGKLVLLPNYKSLAKTYSSAFHNVTPEQLPESLSRVKEAIHRLATQQQLQLRGDQVNGFTGHLLGSVLSVVLSENGWSIQAPLGEDVFLAKSDKEIFPFAIVKTLESGKMSTSGWRQLCSEAGISTIDLERAAQKVAV